MLPPICATDNASLTPQLSGRALPCPARRKRIMKWRTCGAHAMTYHGPLQLLVRRLHVLDGIDAYRLERFVWDQPMKLV